MMADGNMKQVRIPIPGIEHILAGTDALDFRKQDGLNIILSGPAGSGKTLFALQMAYEAWYCGENIKGVIYLSKDMTPEAIEHRIKTVYKYFNKGFSEPEKQSKQNIVLLKDWESQLVNKTPEQQPQFDNSNLNDFFGIADLNLATIPPQVFRSDIWHKPLLSSLKELCPHLINIFTVIEERYSDQAQLIIIIDALSNDLLLECLQKQAERPFGSKDFSTRSVNVFVSEFRELPEEHFASYPPDLHFQFDIRDEGNGYSTKTIQIKKSRMQKVRHEIFPFIIMDQKMKGNIRPVPLRKPVNRRIKCFWKINDKWYKKNVTYLQNQHLGDLLNWDHHSTWEWKTSSQEMDNNKNPNTIELNKIDQITFYRKDEDVPSNPMLFKYKDNYLAKFRTSGIAIFPSLANAAVFNEPRRRKFPDCKPRGIRFGIPDLDHLTYNGMLDSKCCTLLVTENHCNSGLVGLHYLLGDIGYILKKVDEKKNSGILKDSLQRKINSTKTPCLWRTAPRSVLYIALNDDLEHIIHEIFGFSTLRSALATFLSEDQLLDGLKDNKSYINQNGDRIGKLYSIPLRHASCSFSPLRGGASNLYIFIPTLSWTIPEEILTFLYKLLNQERKHQNCPVQDEKSVEWLGNRHPCKDQCRHEECTINTEGDCIDFFPGNCLTIDRVLFNRVGRISSYWPLVKDKSLFISNLAQICQNANADLMIIDDTAVQSSTSGHFVSEWSPYARNIIRLKRVQFHGNETVLFELVRAGSQDIIPHPPQELRVRGGSELILRDSFRGYTQLFSGSPQRCKVIVDLMYDKVDTALYQDVLNLKANLESLMGDRITVNLNGQEKLIGANSAMANLSYVSQDTCHIAAIDEVWLHRMIGSEHQLSGLIDLSARDLISANPQYRYLINVYSEESHKNDSLREDMRHFSGFYDVGNTKKYDEIIVKLIFDRYVTEAFSLARKKGNINREICAIPYRHNWGVFTVSQPYGTRLQRLIGAFMKYSRTLVRDDDIWAWQIIGSLLDRKQKSITNKKIHQSVETENESQGEEKFDIKKISEMIYESIWDSPDGSAASFSWDELIFFKRNVWNLVVPVIQKLIADLTSTDSDNDDADKSALSLIRRHFNDIEDLYFFDFDRSSNESVVCFFLELLLTHEAMDHIFMSDDTMHKSKKIFNTASLLKFNVKNPQELKGAFARTLLRMHQLLSRRQRYEIHAGILPARKRDTGVDNAKIPPVSYALFSREWLSTVPRLTNPFDIREEIKILHLPAGHKCGLNGLFNVINHEADEHLLTNEGLQKALSWHQKQDQPINVGVSLSGMWYLGALSGGNEELAADVIREILSDYHERERLINRSAAPVQHKFYNYKEPIQSAILKSIPYTGIVAEVYKSKWRKYYEKEKDVRNAYLENKTDESIFLEDVKKDMNQPTFPFSRARIREYTFTSLLLIKMIREIMNLNSEDMRSFYESMLKTGVDVQSFTELNEIIDPIIHEIDKIYELSKRGSVPDVEDDQEKGMSADFDNATTSKTLT